MNTKPLRIFAIACLLVGVSEHGLTQTPEPMGSPLGPPVSNAPFSAEATTTIQLVLADGTRLQRTGKARYFRDRIGRVRVEQTIIGVDQLNPAAEGQVRITIYPDPSKPVAYTLDPQARTFAMGPRFAVSSGVGGGRSYGIPIGWSTFLIFTRGDQALGRYGLDESAVQQEALGTQRISGVATVGRRITTTVPAGSRVGNDRPLSIVDERWESTELQILIHARHSNPLTGLVEYQLSNISRTEPPADLFRLPEDYTEIQTDPNSPWVGVLFAEAPENRKNIKRLDPNRRR